MDIVDHLSNEITSVLGVLIVCYIVIKIQRYKRRHMLKWPEVGAGYLSSFADENTGYPRHKRDEKQ